MDDVEFNFESLLLESGPFSASQIKQLTQILRENLLRSKSAYDVEFLKSRSDLDGNLNEELLNKDLTFMIEWLSETRSRKLTGSDDLVGFLKGRVAVTLYLEKTVVGPATPDTLLSYLIWKWHPTSFDESKIEQSTLVFEDAENFKVYWLRDYDEVKTRCVNTKWCIYTNSTGATFANYVNGANPRTFYYIEDPSQTDEGRRRCVLHVLKNGWHYLTFARPNVDNHLTVSQIIAIYPKLESLFRKRLLIYKETIEQNLSNFFKAGVRRGIYENLEEPIKKFFLERGLTKFSISQAFRSMIPAAPFSEKDGEILASRSHDLNYYVETQNPIQVANQVFNSFSPENAETIFRRKANAFIASIQRLSLNSIYELENMHNDSFIKFIPFVEKDLRGEGDGKMIKIFDIFSSLIFLHHDYLKMLSNEFLKKNYPLFVQRYLTPNESSFIVQHFKKIKIDSFEMNFYSRGRIDKIVDAIKTFSSNMEEKLFFISECAKNSKNLFSLIPVFLVAYKLEIREEFLQSVAPKFSLSAQEKKSLRDKLSETEKILKKIFSSIRVQKQYPILPQNDAVNFYFQLKNRFLFFKKAFSDIEADFPFLLIALDIGINKLDFETQLERYLEKVFSTRGKLATKLRPYLGWVLSCAFSEERSSRVIFICRFFLEKFLAFEFLFFLPSYKDKTLFLKENNLKDLILNRFNSSSSDENFFDMNYGFFSQRALGFFEFIFSLNRDEITERMKNIIKRLFSNYSVFQKITIYSDDKIEFLRSLIEMNDTQRSYFSWIQQFKKGKVKKLSIGQPFYSKNFSVLVKEFALEDETEYPDLVGSAIVDELMINRCQFSEIKNFPGKVEKLRIKNSRLEGSFDSHDSSVFISMMSLSNSRFAFSSVRKPISTHRFEVSDSTIEIPERDKLKINDIAVIINSSVKFFDNLLNSLDSSNSKILFVMDNCDIDAREIDASGISFESCKIYLKSEVNLIKNLTTGAFYFHSEKKAPLVLENCVFSRFVGVHVGDVSLLEFKNCVLLNYDWSQIRVTDSTRGITNEILNKFASQLKPNKS